MKRTILAFLLGLAAIAHGQVLVTADTLGKGKAAYFAMSNALKVKNFTTLSLSSVQYWYGASDRIDVFGGVTAITALGQAQFGAIAGANINLVKSRMMSVSAFNAISTPTNRRRDACDALWFTALVVSKNIRVRKFEFFPYTGYAVTVPLRHTAEKLFTPPEPAHNVPAGVMIPKGKFAFFAEYDFGRTLQVAAFGIAYTR